MNNQVQQLNQPNPNERSLGALYWYVLKFKKSRLLYNVLWKVHKMNLSRLPNEMLYAIMERLPIGDLIQVGLVCHRLYDLQQRLLPSVLKTVSSIRIDFEPDAETMSSAKADFYRINEPHRVMVKFGEDNLSRSTYDLLVTKDSIQALATYFPNIKRLTIVVARTPYTYTLLARLYRSATLDLSLLSFWPNLTKLTMIGLHNLTCPKLSQMADSINELKSLKSLALDLPLYNVSFSIYDQLEQLTCKLQKLIAGTDERSVQTWSRTIIETMTRFPNIKSMGLWVDMAFDYVDYSKWPSQVTNRITRLVHLDGAIPAKSSLDVIGAKFSSLTYLHLPSNELTLASALPSLSKLQHLQVLHLGIGVEPPAKESNLPLLKSVKQVTFLNPLDPHQLVAFDTYFPNALRVGFVVDSCYGDSFQKLLCNNEHCANCAFLKRHYFNDQFGDEQVIRVWLD